MNPLPNRPGGSGPRVPLVVPGTRPELAAIEQSILAERGRISPLYQVLLNSAPIAAGWERMLTAVRNQSSVPGTTSGTRGPEPPGRFGSGFIRP